MYSNYNEKSVLGLSSFQTQYSMPVEMKPPPGLTLPASLVTPQNLEHFKNDNRSSYEGTSLDFQSGASLGLTSDFTPKPSLGLPLGPPPGLHPPSNVVHHRASYYSPQPPRHPHPSLPHYSPQSQPSSHSIESPNDELITIDCELMRLKAINDELLINKQQIDQNLYTIQNMIHDLIKKKEIIKNAKPIHNQNKYLASAGGGGGGGYINSYDQPKHQRSKHSDDIPPLTENFVNSVYKILTDEPNLKANQIQSKLPEDAKPPPHSGQFQKMLMKIPGILMREEKSIRKSNGAIDIDRIFYLNNDDSIVKSNKTSTIWKNMCFQKQKGKPCKLNEKGNCIFCK